MSRFPVAVLLLVFAAYGALAQTTARLTGTVKFAGAPAEDVTVLLSSKSMIGVRATTTDSNGIYHFGALPPGEYTVRFESEGAKTLTKKLRIGLTQVARADAELKISRDAEITVTPSSAMFESADVQTNIRASLVEELPVNRTLVGTISLAPGVTANGPNGNAVISGGPSYENLFIIDGAVVNENLRGQPHDLYIEDALEETTILTGAISAEYGRFTGGVVAAISKNGGETTSGSLRDSLQDPSWTARGARGEARPASNLLQTYEATLGGKVIRDRLWFFAAARQFSLEAPVYFRDTTVPFTTGREQTRLELKLTSQLTPRQSFTFSGLDIDEVQRNFAFPNEAAALEPSTLDRERELPNRFLTLQYNAVLSNRFLFDALASRKKFAFVNSGSDEYVGPHGSIEDVARTTNVYSFFDDAYLGAPSFCGVCGDEQRNNRSLALKGTYYAATPRLGSHTIALGVENWESQIMANNHQSGSDFTVWTFTKPRRDLETGETIATFAPGDFIVFWPVLAESHGTNFETQSLFLNDRWDLGARLSFNLGVRYDRNVGSNSAGARVADDERFSPRLAATYDALGDGRLRLNAGYATYSAGIADGNIGDATSVAGAPSLLVWVYDGDPVSGGTEEALFEVFEWFESIGGTDVGQSGGHLAAGGTNGVGTRIDGRLRTPGVEEMTLGAGLQLGGRGYVRADWIRRDWSDFYTTYTNTRTGKVFDPLPQQTIDQGVITNSNDLVRHYDALQVQTSYQPLARLRLGGNYTLSALRGNHVGETASSGPVPATSSQHYPEYLGYERRNPLGWLPEDQRHKLRAWAAWDQPFALGVLSASVLQSFDSGRPYELVATIDPSAFVTPATGDLPSTANPYGYEQLGLPTAESYYISERGAFRWDDITATSLALNFNSRPFFRRMQLFLQAEVRNVFNEQGQVSGDTTVYTAAQQESCTLHNGGQPCEAFNPFTERPVEGVHYVKAPDFGKGLTPTTLTQQGDYQLPRTYLFSAGFRF
ncbi:MAG TPA: carboxypeptidase regulatory-like domain-containing protein [Thermoanaerobaculia bacterium]